MRDSGTERGPGHSSAAAAAELSTVQFIRMLIPLLYSTEGLFQLLFQRLELCYHNLHTYSTGFNLSTVQ